QAEAVRISLPPLEQPSIEPIPQQIEHNLLRPLRRVGYRHLEADVHAHVLPPVECDLELRRDVDVRGCALGEVAIADDLEHRRPEAAEPVLLPETAAEGEPPEERPR